MFRRLHHIVKHPLFKRLQGLKQLGTCHYIFGPKAAYSRYEHSFETADIVAKWAEHLNVSEEKKELLYIGALLQNIDRGPLSHITDKRFCNSLYYRYFRLHDLIDKVLMDSNAFSYHESELIRSLMYKPIKFANRPMVKSQDQKWWGGLNQLLSNIPNTDARKMAYLAHDGKVFMGYKPFDYNTIIRQSRLVNGQVEFNTEVAPDLEMLINLQKTLYNKYYQDPRVLAVDDEIKRQLQGQEIDPLGTDADLKLDHNKIQHVIDKFKA